MLHFDWPDYRTIDFPLVPRHERRRLIRVVVRPQTQAVGGNLCQQGVSFVLIYERDLAHLQKLVMTEGDRVVLKAAEEATALKFEKHLKSSKDEETARATSPYSVATAFYELTGRGIPPFDALDVHPDVIAPPDSPEARVEKQTGSTDAALSMMADAVAKLVNREAQRDQRK
jgi:hypothetical protein